MATHNFHTVNITLVTDAATNPRLLQWLRDELFPSMAGDAPQRLQRVIGADESEASYNLALQRDCHSETEARHWLEEVMQPQLARMFTTFGERVLPFATFLENIPID